MGHSNDSWEYIRKLEAENKELTNENDRLKFTVDGLHKQSDGFNSENTKLRIQTQELTAICMAQAEALNKIKNGLLNPRSTDVSTWAYEHDCIADFIDDQLSSPVSTKLLRRMEVLGGSCGICGSVMIFIRGRYPKQDNRQVCPTCLAERMDNIKELCDPEYGKAYTQKREGIEG